MSDLEDREDDGSALDPPESLPPELDSTTYSPLAPNLEEPVSNDRSAAGERAHRPLNLYKVKEALIKSHGLLTYACRTLGITHHRLMRIINQHPQLQRIVMESEAALVDTAELQLRRRLLDGESWAVMFTLRTKGRDRGYGEEPPPRAAGGYNGTNLTHNGQPVSIQDLIGSLAAQPQFLEYAQNQNAQRCIAIDADRSPVASLITASLIGGNAGLLGGDSESGKVGTSEPSEKG